MFVWNLLISIKWDKNVIVYVCKLKVKTRVKMKCRSDYNVCHQSLHMSDHKSPIATNVHNCIQYSSRNYLILSLFFNLLSLCLFAARMPIPSVRKMTGMQEVEAVGRSLRVLLSVLYMITKERKQTNLASEQVSKNVLLLCLYYIALDQPLEYS